MNSPPAVLNQPSSTTFRTDRLPLAAFIHATEKLRFLGCESSGSRVVFCFADPQAAAPQIELQYERGAVCPATALFASQKFLRRAIDRTRYTEMREDGNYAR